MNVNATILHASRNSQNLLTRESEESDLRTLDTTDFWSYRMVVDFVAGLIGGAAGVLVGHPLDTVKVHLQMDDPHNPKYKGTFHCFRTILYKDKLAGLYRGITSPMGGIGLVNSIVFGVYGNIQRQREDPTSLTTHCIAGGTAGFVQSIVCAPMELVKTRVQLENQIDNAGVKFKGPWDCLKYIIRTEGIVASFRGLTATAARDVPGFASYFVSYEFIMKQRENPSAIYTMFAGGLAGQFSWLACYPIDVVKTTMQSDGFGKDAKYTGFFDCAAKGYQREGLHFYFRGLTSTLIRAFPMNAACFVVVSWILKFFDDKSVDMVMHSSSQPMNVLNMDNNPHNIVQLPESNDPEQVQPIITTKREYPLESPPIQTSQSSEPSNSLQPTDVSTDACKYYIYENDRIVCYNNSSRTRTREI